jgi:hypothetical protein
MNDRSHHPAHERFAALSRLHPNDAANSTHAGQRP